MEQLPPISLCMIVRDEEHSLERCLASVSSLVSEIIVVDTGSTDGTIAIAQKFQAKVIRYDWNGSFAAARNVSIRSASGQWVLVLDADEEVASADIGHLAKLLDQPELFGLYVQIVNLIGAEHGDNYVTDCVCRLFRRDSRLLYSGVIHEDIVPAISDIAGASIGYAPITLLHSGYLDDVIARKSKTERNMRLLLEAVRRNPVDLRMQYALGAEYYQAGDYKRALDIFQPLLTRIPVQTGYMSDLALKTIFALWETGSVAEAEKLADEALRHYPDYSDLLELKAVICLEQDRLPAAEEAIRDALRAGRKPHRYMTGAGAGTYRSRYMAGIVAEKLLEWPNAIENYRIAVMTEPAYLPAWQRLAAVSLATEAGDTLERLLNGIKSAGRRPPPDSLYVSLLEAAVNARETKFAGRLLSRLHTILMANPILEAVHKHQLGDWEQANADLNALLGDSRFSDDASLYLWAMQAARHDKQADVNPASVVRGPIAWRTDSPETFAGGSFHLSEPIPLRGKKLCPHHVEDESGSEHPTLDRQSACSEMDACEQHDIVEQSAVGCEPIDRYGARLTALLRCGAWRTFLALVSHPPASAELQEVPGACWRTFLSAPDTFRLAFVNLYAHTPEEHISYIELIAAAVTAHSLQLYQEAGRLFSLARDRKPGRLEPIAGLADSWTRLAESYGAPPTAASGDISLCLIVP